MCFISMIQTTERNYNTLKRIKKSLNKVKFVNRIVLIIKNNKDNPDDTSPRAW